MFFLNGEIGDTNSRRSIANSIAPESHDDVFFSTFGVLYLTNAAARVTAGVHGEYSKTSVRTVPSKMQTKRGVFTGLRTRDARIKLHSHYQLYHRRIDSGSMCGM